MDDKTGQATADRAMELVPTVMAFTEELTKDEAEQALVLGAILGRCMAGFYAKLAIDNETPEMASEAAAQAVYEATPAIADLAADLVLAALRDKAAVDIANEDFL